MLFSEKVELQQPLEKKALQQKRLDLNQIFFTTSFSLLQNLHWANISAEWFLQLRFSQYEHF